MTITKEDYYRQRAERYPLEDPEALVRYKRALDWMSIRDRQVVREVGCKFSVIRDLLIQNFSSTDYAAIDIDETTLRKIPNYDPKIFMQHNANKGLPFENDSVDYLICLEVLEHLEDATKFFSEAARVLSKNGKLILSVPNPYCWMELIDNIRRNCDTEGHIASYTQQNINALSIFSGLKMEKMQGTFTRVPFSRRFFKNEKIIATDHIFLSRSYMFLLGKS